MTEAEIHKQIVFYLNTILPQDAIIHATLAEGVRGGKRGIIDGARRKAMGQRAGMPDILIFTGGQGYCLEVKSAKGRLSDAQKEVHRLLDAQGIPCAVVRSVEDAREVMREWGLSPKKKGSSLSFTTQPTAPRGTPNTTFSGA